MNELLARHGHLFGTHAASREAGTPVCAIHGQLAISSVNLAELYAGAYKHSQVNRLLSLIADLLQEVQVLDFDSVCAHKFGQVRGTLWQQGISVPTADLMIASVSLVHNLTLVTHNTGDYQNIPGLRLQDWLTPWRGER